MSEVVYEPCPVEGCTRRHRRQYLMCRPCWSRVPKHLRGAVYAAFDAWRAGKITGQELRATQQEAIDHVDALNRGR